MKLLPFALPVLLVTNAGAAPVQVELPAWASQIRITDLAKEWLPVVDSECEGLALRRGVEGPDSNCTSWHESGKLVVSLGYTDPFRNEVDFLRERITATYEDLGIVPGQKLGKVLKTLRFQVEPATVACTCSGEWHREVDPGGVEISPALPDREVQVPVQRVTISR